MKIKVIVMMTTMIKNIYINKNNNNNDTNNNINNNKMKCIMEKVTLSIHDHKSQTNTPTAG